MTVALYVKVFDGIVLATDSATTLSAALPTGHIVSQVYNNADKIFHLHRQLPVAAMTWGLGVVGPASISSLSKSFRLRLMGRDPKYKADTLDLSDFSVEDVADRASKMFGQAANDAGWQSFPAELGYLVVGISTKCDQAEAWLLEFSGNTVEPKPVQVLEDSEYGFRAYAQPDAVNRLFNGYDDQLRERLIDAAMQPPNTADRAQAESQVDTALGQYRLDPVQPGMPLPDAIDLARFMVETTEGYARFRLGADTVGGPVEVASISPHEGFKWINRKHYFTRDLNPGEMTQ
ncbi:hypothetical protein [Mycolicibacterium monacense]|uniref:Uncharacterized protein n=1 Tax=Mycolicibacterium monacense TaxID=85693 RepID=A0AAD1N1J2_MYCMB|nr:hypothetical protein [Mycolicibacterium monacense]MDA4099970.1 hypothetical protein [Mycolicibacterium monacense DSM 44395]ORB11942.1 hypothetical protein BST34_28090 [Mycolicibacterium monacense DSM 44395]QHP84275.1 hypothetical protein EWR22_02250 [Mycolicibacterium monacense DSM 44395]BBZ62980.1 hypothetical protein MMON_42810 [Mycolicibacterium monacense]